MLPLVQKQVLPSFFLPPPPPPLQRVTAGDGNIPASNTSALLYARTRASTETIHPRHATPNVHPRVRTRLGVTQTMRQGRVVVSYTRYGAGNTEREREREGGEEEERGGIEISRPVASDGRSILPVSRVQVI